MQEGKLTLEIATPERLLFSEQVDHVMLPSVEGYMGVLPGHAPLLAKLDIGALSYSKDGVERFFSIGGGFAEVLRHRVQVLAEVGEPAAEIDVERARRAMADAEQRLHSGKADDLVQFDLRLKLALNRVRVAELQKETGRP
jgi:F-type H+-transporting ATPase subunit epsilon